ncbi:hypothetical protein PCANB_002746 [Pneumocystis canis]|nr:hypothetical protein PCK1_002636 [Pneumocystis canis]KAG5438640.1 hypothetical protein PCANB_002746 [Pneumocystis canis]
MGNVYGKQIFYDKKSPSRRLTKKQKNPHSLEIPHLQNRYTGEPIHHFTDIFDPGTNLTSKSDDFYSLPQYTKPKNLTPSMYIDISSVGSSISGKKDLFRTRIQHPSRKYQIDPINNRTSYQYFPARPFHRQNFLHTTPYTTSSQYGSSISNISQYNTYTTSALTSSNETLPTLSSFPARVSNKRSVSPSNIDFGLISSGMLRVVNGEPSPCSSGDEISPCSSLVKSRPVSIEEETLRYSIASESEKIISQNVLERSSSYSSATEQLLIEYYNDKDKSVDEYLSTKDKQEMEHENSNNLSNKSQGNHNCIYKTENMKSSYPMVLIEETTEDVSSMYHDYEHVANHLRKYSQEHDLSIDTLGYPLDIYSKENLEKHTIDFFDEKSHFQMEGSHEQKLSKNTQSCSTFTNIEIQPISSIPNLFITNQRIAIPG